MLTLKSLIFTAVAIVAFFVLIKHVNTWGTHFRNYMLKGSKNFYGRGRSWEGRGALFVSKVVIFFFGLMFIVGVYVLMFS
jgi:dolichol kinase